jgi:transcriptional regulator with XRE-family HTH domain
MVGAYIRTLRAAAGLNQSQFAKRVGISASMLSLIEAGKRDPTLRFLRDVSRALRIPSAALFVLALDDMSENPEDTALANNLRKMSENTLAALQHSLFLQRLEKSRGRTDT